MTDRRRALPSVNALLEHEEIRELLASTPRTLVVEAVRGTLAAARDEGGDAPRDLAGWVTAVRERLSRAQRPSLRPVINATGVVLHTNLGRAPLARAAIEAMIAVSAGYSNLEYDLDAGARGSRYDHCAALLRELTGAEDALVVNNGAAALVLALDTLADGREAVISRGELVEIGGSFRVHDIAGRSRARLREVGATNRTHLADYTRAIGARTGALLKVHRSNFALQGYVAEVDVRALVPAAREHGVPIIHDLGSGLLVSLDDLGLRGEPTVREALGAGASIVTMSGDKLLGGPQAGLVLGDAACIAAMRRNPLARAFRVDRATLAALEATLALYRDPAVARRDIPTLAMLGAPVEALRRRAERVQQALERHGVRCRIVQSQAAVGAGAFPTTELPSVALALDGDAERLSARLRAGDPPVVGRVRDDHLLLDFRTIPDDAAEALVKTVVLSNG
ncbi:MAG TPA: L-seryl-tRNA(Sec) selenium transferase [Gemmatimonadaceae bacterium]|nr:L-seryl-tRNA(Sec) selenium transferase [Gemmatimonadaceae bacterium]